MTRRAQEFLSPGTWTCPPTTTRVELFMVGGGGGGIGGGGGVRVVSVPVSGPQSVTIGAGGVSDVGGTTSFGPGPAPLASVGGGGAPGFSAPSDGGGSGAPGPAIPYAGSYGYQELNNLAGPGAAFFAPNAQQYVNTPTSRLSAPGWNGFGAGGAETTFGRSFGTQYYVTPAFVTVSNGVANTGGGGSSPSATGGSGYLIVRWFE